jgi:hypothetical protein
MALGEQNIKRFVYFILFVDNCFYFYLGNWVPRRKEFAKLRRADSTLLGDTQDSCFVV